MNPRALLPPPSSAAGRARSSPASNGIGYDLLGRDRIDAAIAVFEWNVERFPEAWNVYDSLGEAYAENGDTARAIDNYERSLERNPENDNAVAMLAKLRGGSSD